MPNKRDREPNERLAGIFGILVIVFVLGLFVVFLNMIPNVQSWIEDFLQVDEFMAQVVFFIGLLVGILGFTYLAWQVRPEEMRQKKRKRSG